MGVDMILISAIFALWDCIINVKIKVSYIGEYFYTERKIRGFCSYMINLPLNVFELKFGVNFVDLVQWLQVRNVGCGYCLIICGWMIVWL